MPRNKTYGSPRIYVELIGFRVSENTVAKYMKELGLDARLKKKFKVKTTDSNHNSPIADRLFKVEDHNSLPSAPGEVLAGDITYLKLVNKFLYLAVVMDIFTREVVGWSMQRSLHKKTVLDALASAMTKTGPDAQVIFHSDRGSQYANFSNLGRDLLGKSRDFMILSREIGSEMNANIFVLARTIDNEIGQSPMFFSTAPV